MASNIIRNDVLMRSSFFLLKRHCWINNISQDQDNLNYMAGFKIKLTNLTIIFLLKIENCCVKCIWKNQKHFKVNYRSVPTVVANDLKLSGTWAVWNHW